MSTSPPTDQLPSIPDEEPSAPDTTTTTAAANNITPTPRTTTRTTPPRRRQKQLSTDSLNWGIPHNHEATLHVQEEEGEYSWQYKLIKTLHGRRVQTVLASLLLLDVLILFCELALLTLYPSCQLVERDAISCCPVSNQEGNNQDESLRWLAGKGSTDDKYYSCAPGWGPVHEYEATCDSHKWHTVHVVEDVLISLTLFILTTFFVELTLCMIAMTPKIFFRQVFYTLDYLIVAISLGLEVTFFSLGDDVLASLVGLVIMGRLWRFIRIGHGIIELTGEAAHERQVQEQVYMEELEELLQKNGIPLPDFIPHPSGQHDCDLLERVHKKHIDKKRRSYHASTSETS